MELVEFQKRIVLELHLELNPTFGVKKNPQLFDLKVVKGFFEWSHLGSNQGPTDYESATLTN